MSIRSLLRRLLTSVALPALGAGVAFAATWGSLPDSIAIHWGASGDADGFASPLAGVVLVAGLIVGLGTLSIVIAALTPATSPGGRWGPAVLDATTWALVAMVTASIVTQRSDQEAPGLQAWWILLGVAVGAVGALISRAGPRQEAPSRERPVPADAPRLATPPAGVTWWIGRAPVGASTIAASVGLAALGLVLGWTTSWWVAVVHVPVALALVAFCSARVTVGAERIVIAGGLGGWPRLRVELDTVTEAKVTDLKLLGWGVGLRVRPGATGYITRGGEALEVTRTDGTRVVVTVDDALDAAATVNSILDRSDAVR